MALYCTLDCGLSIYTLCLSESKCQYIYYFSGNFSRFLLFDLYDVSVYPPSLLDVDDTGCFYHFIFTGFQEVKMCSKTETERKN